ncbi:MULTISPECIES: TonB-dependent receptor [unclassified Microbulbifer]|uniref:TonB-dependent receptor n=1 Tax=unclassified Microbulbifer TaxID=2619833 RepID=UPI0027E57C48|nr:MULTISPECIES: TonB-dependent receptor [unclassified Microbulbifer]
MTDNNKRTSTFTRKKLPHYIRLASGASLLAMGAAMPAFAQDSEADEAEYDATLEEVVVTGQRASIRSAQDLKRDASQIVDSIVATDIGKLPDRSISEALQRVPGITVTRYDNMGDPEHFAGEGSGVAIRGLSQVRAELNGREVFSANGGRTLSFDDVPAELMSGVDTYKSPTADMIEGGLGGVVNLRTRMPFDSDGQLMSATIKGNYGDQIEETNGEYSALYSNRWETNLGEFGLLVDVSSSDLSSRADNIYTRAYQPRDDIEEGKTVWVPRGVDWRRNDYQSERDGQYLALQWAPNDDTEAYFTAFHSKHKRRWDEAGFFTDVGGGLGSFLPSKGADDWTYDSSGVMKSGTLTTAQGNGVPFGTSTYSSDNTSDTSDFALGVKWQATERLSVNTDLQYVKSTTETENYLIGLVTYPDTLRVDNLGGAPSIYVDDDFLSDFTNYSYGQMQSQPFDNEAESKAVRLDLEYDFENSIVRSVQAGARFSEKSSDNREGFSWAARYQPWMAGWYHLDGDYDTPEGLVATTADLPTISDPSNLVAFSYGDFQRGDVNVPGSAYMINPSLLRDFRATTDSIVANTPGGAAAVNWDALDLNSAGNINTQDETTQAIYAKVNFAFDDLAMPVDGNLGVRYVRTENVAHGQLSFPTFEVPGSSERPYYQDELAYDAENKYSHVLPSLNLRLHATDDLLLRFAASKAIWRPAFSDMRALMSLSADWKEGITPPTDASGFDPSMIFFSLSSDGNPFLEPMKANQYDLSAEWYFDDNGGMAHLNLFYKDVSDFFRTVTENTSIEGFDVVSSWKGNVGTADIQGAEVGFTKFFDFLPEPWNGFGVQANYTYIDSSTDVPDEVEPLNTDGSTYGDLPFEGLSKHAYNLVGMYEKNGLYARLAWNWRSEYLVAVGPNGWNHGNENWRLPIYNDDYGQLDLSLGYDITDNVSVNFEAANITKEDTVGLMDQGDIGMRHAYTYSQDVRYAASVRVTF